MALTVAEIDTAIQKILTTGQTVSVDGMTFSNANLSSLHTLRQKVQLEESASKRPTGRAFSFTGMGYS
jgi:hypothetical protein